MKTLNNFKDFTGSSITIPPRVYIPEVAAKSTGSLSLENLFVLTWVCS
jgi:hypothetical protein